MVSDAFNPELVKNCKFYGWSGLANWKPYSWNFIISDCRLAYTTVPLSVVILEIMLCIDNVNYLSHYIIGNEVMIVNVNELATTDHSKFGNGILKEGETENVRIWMEICNENGGRSIMPFNGMLPVMHIYGAVTGMMKH